RDFVTKSSKHSFKINIAQLLELSYENEQAITEIDIKFMHLVDLMKSIAISFETKSSHFIIIDGLDEILSSREIQYQSLAALITQVKELNRYFLEHKVP